MISRIKTKAKKETVASLKKELDDIFSLYIRARDADHQGTVTCFVSGERVWWRDAENGHFMKRGNMITRYDERNCHAVSKESNRFDDEHDNQYRIKMTQVYGPEVVAEIEFLSKNDMTKFTVVDMKEKIEEFTAKFKEVKKKKGL